MKKLLFALSLVLLFTACALGQKPTSTKTPVPAPAMDTLKMLQAEKEALLNISKEIEAKHMQLIERGDKLHDISVSWISTGVGFLGVLFAIGAIVVGWLLYTQSKEYKQKMNESLGRLQASYEKLYSEQDKYLKIIRKRLDITIKIADQLNKERSGKAGSEVDTDFAETVDALQILKEEIDSMVGKSSAEKRELYNSLYWSKMVGNEIWPIFKVSCSRCNNSTLLYGREGVIFAFSGEKGKSCPSCHRTDGVKIERLPD